MPKSAPEMQPERLSLGPVCRITLGSRIAYGHRERHPELEVVDPQVKFRWERFPKHFFRFFAVCLVLAIPIIGGTVSRVHDQKRAIAEIARETVGLRTGQIAADLLAATERYRLDEVTPAPAPAQTLADLTAMKTAISELSRPPQLALADSGPRASVSILWSLWHELERGTTPAARARATVPLADAVLSLLMDIADRSGLTYDPTVEAVNLVDALAFRLPGLTERLDQSDQLVSFARDGRLTRVQLLAAEKLSGRAHELRVMAADDLDGGIAADPTLEPRLRSARVDVDGSATKLTASIDATLDAGDPPHDRGRADRRLRSASIVAGRRLSATLAQAMQQSCANRINALKATVNLAIAVSIALLTGSFAIVAFLWRATRQRDRVELDLAHERAQILETTLARRSAERALRMTEQQFRAVFDGSHVGIALMECDGSRIDANAALGTMFEHDLTQLIRTATALCAQLVRDGGHAARTEHCFALPGGAPLWAELSLSLTRENEAAAVSAIVLVHDITDHKTRHEQLDYQTLHDELTALPNRLHFMRRLETLLRDAREPFAVVFIDLDNFKSVNDTLGHHMGDRVLRLAAQRLSNAVRPIDFVARLHGDEFAVLLGQLTAGIDDREMSAIIARLQAELYLTIETHAAPIEVTASLGVVRAGSSYTDPEALLRDADTAMYRSKLKGRACATLHDPGASATSIIA